MCLAWIETKLELIEDQLNQIIAILNQEPIIRPSSYSQSLHYREKLHERKDKRNPEDTVSR